MKKTSVILFVLLSLLLFCSGCSTFRKLFNSDHRRERRDRRREALLIKKPAKDRPPRDTRDPLMDMFKVKNKPEYMHDKDLTPQERALLKQEMNSADQDSMIRSIRSDYKSEQKKRHDWVFSR